MHTHGPWESRKAKFPIDGQFDWGVSAEIDGKRYAIAEAFGRVAQDVLTPAEANARLIAAAPELLQVLIDLHTHCVAADEYMRAAEFMIAKVMGNQP
jgi:hypothetical protein